MSPGLLLPSSAMPATSTPKKVKTKTQAWATPASAFEDSGLLPPVAAAAETPEERAARKAAKAARKTAKVKPEAGAEGGEASVKKRKRADAPAADVDAAQPEAAKAPKLERLSNSEYRKTHEIKARSSSRARGARRRP